MKKRLFIGICLLFIGVIQAQESKLRLDVSVVDQASKPILGVSVYFKELKIGGYTDENGKTFIEAPKGRYELIIESLGYENLNQKINLFLPSFLPCIEMLSMHFFLQVFFLLHL